MKLEEEIKQKKFRNEFHKLAVNLIYTNSWLMSYQSALLKKYDITAAQYNILRILRGQHPSPASVNLLKERMLDKMSDASRLVDRLLAKKLVERNVCLEDRRRVEIKISRDGLKILEEIDKSDNDFDNKLKSISSAEAKQLNELLDKVRG